MPNTEMSQGVPILTKDILDASFELPEKKRRRIVRGINAQLRQDQSDLSTYIDRTIHRYMDDVNPVYSVLNITSFGLATSGMRRRARNIVLEVLTLLGQQQTQSIDAPNLNFLPEEGIGHKIVENLLTERESGSMQREATPDGVANSEEGIDMTKTLRAANQDLRLNNPLLLNTISRLTGFGAKWTGSNKGGIRTLPMEASYIATYGSLAAIQIHSRTRRSR